MSYQVRHKELGIFQGEFMGFEFWWPASKQPELGFHEFSTKVAACTFIAYMCKKYFKVEDFEIEPFDDFEMQLVKIEEN